MFTKKHTPTYEAVASEMKAMSGRHARLDRVAPAPASVDSESSCSDMVSAAELESKFQEFFRMGAVVAIGELYDEGMLGNKEAVAEDVRDYLDSFGVAGLDDIRALGISGPYLEDFERMYAMPASFPPAA